MLPTTKPKSYLRVANVRARYKCSDAWITRKTRDRGFPHPVVLGGRDRFWIESELDAWDETQIAQGRVAPLPVPPRKTAAPVAEPPPAPVAETPAHPLFADTLEARIERFEKALKNNPTQREAAVIRRDLKRWKAELPKTEAPPTRKTKRRGEAFFAMTDEERKAAMAKT